MLNIITKSKIRQNILRLLFSHQSNRFYLSEIAKIIHTSRGTAQRELNKLIQSGIIKTEKKATIRYYFINKQNPLLKELKKIINNTIGVEVELKKVIKKIKGIEYAFIYGSYIKGNFSADSDIDLIIIGKPDENQLINKIKNIEKLINREINYHLYSNKEFKTKFKKNSFLKNIIKNYLLLTNNQDGFNKLLS